MTLYKVEKNVEIKITATVVNTFKLKVKVDKGFIGFYGTIDVKGKIRIYQDNSYPVLRTTYGLSYKDVDTIRRDIRSVITTAIKDGDWELDKTTVMDLINPEYMEYVNRKGD